MGAQFNIKNAEVRELAGKVAQHMGVDLTEAVKVSLKEQLRYLTRAERMSRVEALVDSLRDKWTDEERNTDYRDWLYDDRGLPK